ncbi:MAG: IS1182 family transposase [Cetobacterium sp.]
MKNITFKNYNKSQLALPVELEVFIPDNHIVRIVDQIVDSIDISPLLELYKGGGSSAYHPKMLLKVIIYAYTQRIYSGRVIAKNLRENIYFMWISAKNTPNFRTINNFRSKHLKNEIDTIFANVTALLYESGHIKLENCFVDGTKIEANANKYSFVWKKSRDRYNENLRNKINANLEEISNALKNEEEEYQDKDLEEVEAEAITPEKLKEVAKKIDESLTKEDLSKEKSKVLKKCKRELEKDQIPRLEKYIEQEKILGDRNSYSKTDNDATFMRMKEDHMKNGQLKPAYNVQISTENQFIINYTIHQKPGDTTTLIPHLNIMRERIGIIPTNIIADAGYGSLENYEFLSENNLNNFIKYNNWLNDFRGKTTSKIFVLKDFIYNKENDYYICLNGEHLHYQNTTLSKTITGYVQSIRNYRCFFCGDCSFRDLCTTSKYGRTLSINPLLEEYKQKVRENLSSENGSKLRKKRSVDVEPVFGMIKNNRYFKRFMLRGLPKVNIEWGLLSLAHNLMKLVSSLKSSACF